MNSVKKSPPPLTHTLYESKRYKWTYRMDRRSKVFYNDIGNYRALYLLQYEDRIRRNTLHRYAQSYFINSSDIKYNDQFYLFIPYAIIYVC